MPLFDATLSILEQSMNVRLDRQNLLASNLANANTPGYAAKDVDFDQVIHAAAEQLEASANAPAQRLASQSSLAMSNDAQLSIGRDGMPGVATLDPGEGRSSISLSLPTPMAGQSSPEIAMGGAVSLDQNRVDTDHAMVALASNALNYGASAKAIAKKMAILSYCANDGQG